MAIEVRTTAGPVFQAAFIFENARHSSGLRRSKARIDSNITTKS